MVEPVTIIFAVISFFGIISKGIDLFKKYVAPAPVTSSSPLAIVAQTYPTTIGRIENLPEFDDENSKKTKDSLSSEKDRNSSSNSGFPIGVIFVILLVLGVMGFLVYHKQNKLKENRIKFRQSGKQFDSPASPSTTQNDFDSTIV